MINTKVEVPISDSPLQLDAEEEAWIIFNPSTMGGAILGVQVLKQQAEAVTPPYLNETSIPALTLLPETTTGDFVLTYDQWVVAA